MFGFADGENLVLRFQNMCSEGHKPNADVLHLPDVLVWHPQITDQQFSEIIRITYYQSLIGDQNKIDDYRKLISDVHYHFFENDTPLIRRTNSLKPRVFKKEHRSKKTRTIDINLTIDALRHTPNYSYDIFFLLSGDGDFVPLVEEMANQGKQVWVAAFSKGLSNNLRFSADEFINLDDIFFYHPA